MKRTDSLFFFYLEGREILVVKTGFSLKKFKKKEKKRSEKVPKSRKIATKGLKRLVMGGILVFGLSGFVAIFLFVGTRSVVSSLNKDVGQIKTEMQENKGSQIQLTPELESFMNRFVALYMNVSSDSAIQKEREKTLLEDYYASDIPLKESSFSGERKLDSASFIALKKVDGVNTACYKVTYTITTTDNKEKEIRSTETQVLNLPYRSSQKGARILSYPYFTLSTANQEKATYLVYDSKNYQAVDTKVSEEVLHFTEEFLSKYAKGSASDMEYMMNTPEGLEGTAKFDSLTGKVFERKKGYVVKATVTFKNPKTNYSWQEDMTLEIVKKSDKYFVERLTHTLSDDE